MKVGYAGTSTLEQVAGFEAQIAALEAAGCERVFREQVSSVSPRSELQAALTFVPEGDVLTVTKLDRLARSVAHMGQIVAELEKRKVGLRVLNFVWHGHVHRDGSADAERPGLCSRVRAGNDAGAAAGGHRQG